MTTQLIVDQFSPVKNRNLSPPEFTGSPLTSNELGVSFSFSLTHSSLFRDIDRSLEISPAHNLCQIRSRYKITRIHFPIPRRTKMVYYQTWRIPLSPDRTRRERINLEFVEGERVGEWHECGCWEWGERIRIL